MQRDERRAQSCNRTDRLDEFRMNAGKEGRHPSAAGHPGENSTSSGGPVPGEELCGELSKVVDVQAVVPFVAGSDRLDCLRKNDGSVCRSDELLETGQPSLACRGGAGSMKAHDDR